MMDAIVQFVRNALCCIKDLNLFEDSFLYDASVVSNVYAMPAPCNKTTPLELGIAVSQLYACLSLSLTGINLIYGLGLNKLARIDRLLTLLLNGKKGNPKSSSSSLTTDLIVESLQEERIAAAKSIFLGTLVGSIGVSFFWLFANSLHVTETLWIGGLPGLIHALTVMEVALVPLLVYMIADGIAHIAKASRIQFLAFILRKCHDRVPSCVGNKETYAQVLDWTPFWEGTTTAATSSTTMDKESTMLDEEIKAVSSELERWVADKDNATMESMLLETATRLEITSRRTKMEGYREFVYFMLNLIAFYGYLLGILVYYFDEHDDDASYLHTLKLGMSHDAADWHGNFAGDLMWTIEPLIILTSPMLLQSWSQPPTPPKSSKAKTE